MPHYFFDVEDGVISPDLDGVDLPDIAAAQKEALQMTGRMVEDQSRRGSDADSLTVTVRDGLKAVLTVSVRVQIHT